MPVKLSTSAFASGYSRAKQKIPNFLWPRLLPIVDGVIARFDGSIQLDALGLTGSPRLGGDREPSKNVSQLSIDTNVENVRCCGVRAGRSRPIGTESLLPGSPRPPPRSPNSPEVAAAFMSAREAAEADLLRHAKGDYSPSAAATKFPEPALLPLDSFKSFEAYSTEAALKPSTVKRWRPVFEHLVSRSRRPVATDESAGHRMER